MIKKSPHRYRRTNIHVAIILIILTALAVVGNISCTPQHGCYATRKMAGYSHCPTLNEAKNDSCLYYLKNKETQLVIITNEKTNIICSYYDKPNK
jgi:hypothetical protein